MPITPLHIFPAAPVYFLLFRRLNGLAFFFGTFLIDLEPLVYLLFGVNCPQIPLLSGGFALQGLHMITHSPFSIVFLVATAMTLLTKLAESTTRGLLLEMLPTAQWISYSWKQTYLSALFGAFLHLGWDVTMHYDVNLGFPFVNIPNTLVNSQAFSTIFLATLLLILPTYLLGKRINKSSPFKKLP